ncbi:MAG TPA: class D beta-lactamase [Magnetospirillaceae bacterium]|nr:class D beta-lactamase [Magnetospirillaceae bacterium]
MISQIRRLTYAALLLFASASLAGPSCTLVADAQTGAVLVQQGPCDQRNSPASTFKVALAVMGYQSGILLDAHTPLWPYRSHYKSWDADFKKKPTDPTSWLKDSVVWYSRLLVQHMGHGRLQAAVDGYDYGNHDISGTPGFKEALPEAVWVDSTLQISPVEQVAFLRKIVNRQLPQVSPQTYDKVAEVMPAFDASGWAVHGKTGTGYQPGGTGKARKQYGWFVGWAVKDKRAIVFARLDKDDARRDDIAGIRVRDEFLAALPGLVKKSR